MFALDVLSVDEHKQLLDIGIILEEKEYTYEMLIELIELILDKEVLAINKYGTEKAIVDGYSHVSDAVFEMIKKEKILSDKPYQYKRPAIVRFVKNQNPIEEDEYHALKQNKYYLAYYVEYWETERDNLHVKNESGRVDYWYELEDFEIFEDKDGSLELQSATVKCINPRYSRGNIMDPAYGEICEAIGISRDGYYLIYSGSHNYYYSPEDFEIIEDLHSLLDKHKRNWFLCYGI